MAGENVGRMPREKAWAERSPDGGVRLGHELEVGEGTDTRGLLVSVIGRGRREAQRWHAARLGQNKEAGSLCSLSKAHLTS